MEPSPASPPKRIAVLACGPSLKEGWNENNTDQYDAVIAVNTAAWRYRCDWLVFSDGHVFDRLTSQPRVGFVTNSHIYPWKPELLVRRLPIGEYNSLGLSPAMQEIADEQGMGQCNWTLPNALRFAHQEYGANAIVTLYGFDCSAGPCVGGVDAPGSHDAARWAKELPWVRECFRMGKIVLHDSCRASQLVREYLNGKGEIKTLKPIVAVPFFPPVVPDLEQGKRLRQLLNEWRRRWDAAGSKADAAVITEQLQPHGWEPLWVNADDLRANPRLVRPGQVWDVNGAMVLAALAATDRPLLVMDADAFVINGEKLDAELARLAILNPVIAMAPDGWARTVETLEGKEVRQRQAGVMWFGGGADLHAKIIEAYQRAFPVIAEQFQDGEQWLEQLTWTAVWADLGGHALPAVLNVPHLAPEETRNKAAVVHYHGPIKWEMLPKQEP